MSDTLQDIARQIEATGKPRILTVRKLLEIIGQERRGKLVNRGLRALLRRSRLKCQPDFDDVHIDAEVTLSLGPRLGRPPREQSPETGPEDGIEFGDFIEDKGAENPSDLEFMAAVLRREIELPQEQASNAADKAPVAHDAGAAVTTEPEPAAAREREVIVTVRQGVPAAGCPPVFVRRNEPVRRALTMMIDGNLGQLVVMSSERGQVEGVFTWQSYGRAVLANRRCETVGDCLSHDYREVKESMPLFDVVREIIRHGTVVVRARDNCVCGLVTQRDVADVFVDLAEPFLFLGQIENHLRELVERMQLSREEFSALVASGDPDRAARTASVDDLTLGELIRVLQQPEHWTKLGLLHDRTIVLQRLERVRKIRNKVMHFDADKLPEEEKRFLTDTRRILQEL